MKPKHKVRSDISRMAARNRVLQKLNSSYYRRYLADTYPNLYVAVLLEGAGKKESGKKAMPLLRSKAYFGASNMKFQKHNGDYGPQWLSGGSIVATGKTLAEVERNTPRELREFVVYRFCSAREL